MEEISLKPDEFTKVILLALQDEDVEYLLEEIDDYLTDLISKTTCLETIDAIKSCAKIAVEAIDPDTLGFSYSWALHSLIACDCILGKIEDVIINLNKLIAHCKEIDYQQPCISAIMNIKNGVLGDIAADKYPSLMKIVIEYLKANSSEQEVANCYAAIAYFFSDKEAYKAASDTLDDAMEYLEECLNKECMVTVQTVRHSIYIISENHEYALSSWAHLSELCKELEIEIPSHAIMNHATFLMRNDQYDSAIELYIQNLSRSDCTSIENAIISSNLSACYREIGDIGNAIKYIDDARKIIADLGEDSFDNSILLEIELIDAKNHVLTGNSNALKASLLTFTERMNATLERTFKLHYRRGIRNRYVARFEALVACLPQRGPITDIIPLLSFSRINQAADWLSILKWKDDISQIISSDENEQLSDMIDKLSAYGAPHLYGFSEKYDNALYDINYQPWDKFITLVEKLYIDYDIPLIYFYSSQMFVSNLLLERLKQGATLAFDFSSSHSKLIVLNGDEYIIEALPEVEGRSFFIELNKFRFSGENRKEFNCSLIAYQAALNASLTETVSILEGDSNGIIFFPSKMDFLPINLLLVSNDLIRNKMAVGDFSISSCLCLHPRAESNEVKSCLGVVESLTNLEYDRAEINHFIKITGIVGDVLSSPTQEEFFEKSSDNDIIIISQHGMSVGMYADPVFADLSGPHAERKTLSYELLQSNAYKMKHKLVMLNACYGGAFVNRNFFKSFRTHELIGYPQAFLLNRKSMVIAASWTIVDRYNALLMHNFSHVFKKYGASKAYSMSLARTYEMTSDEMIAALHEITEGTHSLSHGLALDTMKVQPFCFSTYHNYTLL